jgi:aspartate racemase
MLNIINNNSNAETLVSVKSISPVVQQYVFPVSFSQQGLWVLDNLAGSSENYIIPSAFRLHGKLDVRSLELALNAIIDRHEALRTFFFEQDGIPLQVIQSSFSIPLRIVDLVGYSEQQRVFEVARLIKYNEMKAFDLKKLPLLRFQLIKIEDEEYIFLLAFHHIISDGWSMGVFTSELSLLYGEFSQQLSSPLSALQFQYADYSIWQRESLQGERFQQLSSYWKLQLSDVPILELPTDRIRPVVQSYRGQRQSFSLSLELTEKLKALSRCEEVTLFMTLFSGFQVLLHRYSGQDDIVIGTPTAGRSNLELEGLIGYLVNTLALRTNLSGDPSFRELLGRVRVVSVDAYANQDMPFEKMIEVLNPQRDPSRHPLFQIMFVFQNTPEAKLQLNEMSVDVLKVSSATTKFDLTLELSETLEGLTGSLEYATDLFDASTIARLIGHFQTLLEGIIAHPEARLSELPLLTESERHQLLVEWNNTYSDYPKDKCIHQLFEEQVERTPDAIALVFEDQQLSYQLLNTKANQLAHYLKAIGVQADTLVAICMERSIDLVISLLAILKAGGAYVPLDLSYPRMRLDFMLEDTKVHVLLTQTEFVAQFSGFEGRFVCLDTCWNDLVQESTENPLCNTNSNCLAYIIYTSGSTGQPKGVEIRHFNISRLLINNNYAQFDNKQKFLLLAPVAFDASTFEIWGGLLHGACCVVYPERVPTLERLEKIINGQQISILWLTASLFNTIIDEKPQILSTVKQILTGGEALSKNHIERALKQLPHTQLINGYGPTESTTFACCYLIPKMMDNQINSIPIGRAISNTTIYILDKYSQLVPIGVAGELYIGGDGLARGYLNSPELTNEKFITNSFSNCSKSRLYKTGDLARYLDDGSIQFLGRIDHQVKIRGFRIELGEIESVLEKHPETREVVVSVYEPILGDKRLVAYLVSEKDFIPSVSELREFLKLQLPEYMIPSAFVFLDALPLTPNGKLDRKALPEPDQHRYDLRTEFIAPRSQLEIEIAGIWENLLGIDQIGIEDNFFDLGGHSLLAIKMIIDVNKLFNSNLPFSAIYQCPTIKELGMMFSSRNQQLSSYSLVPIQIQGSRPILFAVHTLSLKDLPRYLGNKQPLYFLRYGMAAESTDCSIRLPPIKELASHYIKEIQQIQPQGPYYLIGFSFGGLIAYEMACQLEENGHQVNFIGLLDTYLVHEKQFKPICQIIQKLLTKPLSQLLTRVKNNIANLMMSAKYGTDFWPHKYTSAPDIASGTGYEPKIYNGKWVTLFQGDKNDSLFFDYALPEGKWKTLLGDKLDVKMVNGNHFEMCNEPYVSLLSEKLIGCIDKMIESSSLTRS